jgi:two-component system chemotaxis sensor kinase CheA
MAFDADMAEIAQLFVEESMEGLDIIESSLLSLDVGAVDPDVINEIFRAAHSIKGGGGTFGFVEIAEFAHRVETLLDEVRQGQRPVTTEIVDIVLEAVDCLRNMVSGLESDAEIDTNASKLVEAKIDRILSGELNKAVAGSAMPDASDNDLDTELEIVGWKIDFAPHAQALKSGNEPTRIFTALSELGDVVTTVKGIEKLDFDSDDATECSLSWRLKLFGDAAREQVDEVFAWTLEECELTIEPIYPPASTAGLMVVSSSGQSGAATAPARQTDDSKSVTAAAPGAAGLDKSAANPKATVAAAPAKKADAGSIRVGIDKVDALINLVGELVITQSMLGRFGQSYDFTQFSALKKGLAQLTRNTRELQESVMQIRMMPISFAFSRFPRLVRDTSKKLGKNVELVLNGEGTELDKTVLEKIGDPLVHLVRNSLDHGLETPQVRAAAGKPETGTLTLSAYHEGGNIIIEVSDDGAGINRDKVLSKAAERGLVEANTEISDEEVYAMIFMPGFSTVDAVSNLSGRGVGMDVVRRNIADLGGHVSIRSATGTGSTFTIRLPLTLAILDGQLITVSGHTYIVPLVSIVETVQMSSDSIATIAAEEELFKLRDEYIPIIRLHGLFGMNATKKALVKGLLVVVESNGQRVGLFVDDLQEQQQVVIKSLETNFTQMRGISGATILGDGTVALILDVRGLIDLFLDGSESCARPAVA